MLRRIFFVLIGIASVAICVAGFFYGKQIPFTQQWPLFEALRNTASIIFAVVGAWLAIIYPERLRLSFGKKNGRKATNGNIGLLLTPAIHSTIILVILLLVGIVAPIAKQISLFSGHVELCRGLSFLLVCILTLWQATIVVMTIFPAEAIQALSNRDAAESELESQYGKLRRKQEK